MTRKVMEHKLHIKRETIRQIILEGLGNRQMCMKFGPPPSPSPILTYEVFCRDCEPLRANDGLVDFRHLLRSPDLAPADFFLLPKMKEDFGTSKKSSITYPGE
jgi:hypothetical protein